MEELLLSTQRENGLDVAEGLFGHTIDVLSFHLHKSVVTIHFPPEVEGTEEDERRDDKRQDSELPTLNLKRKNDGYASKTDNNACGKTGNRME